MFAEKHNSIKWLIRSNYKRLTFQEKIVSFIVIVTIVLSLAAVDFFQVLMNLILLFLYLGYLIANSKLREIRETSKKWVEHAYNLAGDNAVLKALLEERGYTFDLAKIKPNAGMETGKRIPDMPV